MLVKATVAIRDMRTARDFIAHIPINPTHRVRDVHAKLLFAPLVGLSPNRADIPFCGVDVSAHIRLEARVAHAFEARLDDTLVDGLRRPGYGGREERPALAERCSWVVTEVVERGGVAA